MRMVYTDKMKEWLSENISKYPSKEFTKRFNETFNVETTRNNLLSVCYNLGLHSGRGTGIKTDRLGKIKVYKKGSPKIKVREGANTNNWMPLSVYLWEQEHGKIPEGQTVIFIDDDRMHCELSNLYLIDRKLFLSMRGLKLSWWDMESLEAAINTAKLKALVRKREKNA